MSIRDLLIGISLMCLWGLNFSVIKLGADQINPILLTAMRFFFAMFPAILFISRPQVPIRYLVAYGLSFGVGIWGMMTWSITLGLSAGMSGVLLQLSLVFSLLLGWGYLKESIQLKKKIGASLALLGLAVTLMLQDGSVPKSALLFALIASFSWSLTALIVKVSKTKQVFAFSVWGMSFAPIPLLILAWVSHGADVFVALPGQLNTSVWFSVLFQAYPTTLLGYWIWNKLVLKYPLSTTSLLTTLVPVFGILGSVVFYGEQLSQTKLLACGLILSGLLVSQLQWRTFSLLSMRKNRQMSEN